MFVFYKFFLVLNVVYVYVLFERNMYVCFYKIYNDL